MKIHETVRTRREKGTIMHGEAVQLVGTSELTRGFINTTWENYVMSCDAVT